MKAALHNLGCKTNSYETEAMEQALVEAGYDIVTFAGDEIADVYIINTCSVTNIADRKSRQMIHKARSCNPSAVIVAVGCFVQTNADKINELAKKESIDICLGSNDKHKLVRCIEDYFTDHLRRVEITDFKDKSAFVEYEGLALSEKPQRTRAFIKIEDGCDQFCTFCIIPYARGRVRSRPLADICMEAETLSKKGISEIVLTGINMSAYGKDFKGVDEGLDISNLILSLEEISGIRRIRVSSVEPRLISKDFLEIVGKSQKLCPHFHLSLQSGSDGVLRRMNRKYTTKEYLEKVNLLRKYYKNPAITTDVIVGFPGETETEFFETLEFVRSIDFFDMHIFQFSERQGTPAANMSGKVDGRTKRLRSAALISAAEDMRNRCLDNMYGINESVLVEEVCNEAGVKYYTGHTGRYVKVYIPFQSDNIDGDFVDVIIGNRFRDGVIGSWNK